MKELCLTRVIRFFLLLFLCNMLISNPGGMLLADIVYSLLLVGPTFFSLSQLFAIVITQPWSVLPDIPITHGG